MSILPVVAAVVVLAVILVGLASTLLIWWVWGRDRERSWLLWTIAVGSSLVEFSAIWFTALTFIRVIEGPSAVPQWTAAISLVAIICILSVPSWLAFQFLRRGRSRK